LAHHSTLNNDPNKRTQKQKQNIKPAKAHEIRDRAIRSTTIGSAIGSNSSIAGNRTKKGN